MTPPVTLPSAEAFYLMGGAVVGVLVRAWATNGQSILCRETLQDAFLAVVLAVAWLMPVGSLWPPFEFPATSAPWMHGVMFAGGTWLFIEMVKAALLKWAPVWFAKYTGQEPTK